MAYNAADLIEKSISISKIKVDIYGKIKNSNLENKSMSILIDILIKDTENTIIYYKKLLTEANETKGEEIDFFVYDKISFLINQFKERIYVPDISNVKDFIVFSLDFEKQSYGLLVDIQGRLVQDDSDTKTKAYKLLSKIIKRKTKLIEIIEKLVR